MKPGHATIAGCGRFCPIACAGVKRLFRDLARCIEPLDALALAQDAECQLIHIDPVDVSADPDLAGWPVAQRRRWRTAKPDRLAARATAPFASMPARACITGSDIAISMVEGNVRRRRRTDDVRGFRP
jgi:hypothetical protein